jgi:hypothetical protein
LSIHEITLAAMEKVLGRVGVLMGHLLCLRR